MVFSKFSNCQVTSLEVPWIKKPSGTSVLPGVNKLTVIFVLCVFLLYVFVLRINCFLLNSLRLLTMLLPEPDLHCVGPAALWEFCNIFSPNTGEDQKKSYHLSAVPLTLRPMVNRLWFLHYVHEKVRRWLS